MSEESWAVAALAIVDSEGTPLTLRTYTSPDTVVQSPEAPLQAHLYVGPEDIIQLHFILFSSLDRCEERREANRRAARAAARRPREKNENSSVTTRAGANASLTATLPNASVVSRHEASEVRGGTTATSSVVSMSRSFAHDTSRLVTPTTDVRFVGQLMKDFRFAAYGFCSVTRITTILVTVGPGEAPQDAMVPLCRAIYECASAALCNPFNTSAQNWHAQQALMAKSAQAWWRRQQLRRSSGGSQEQPPSPQPPTREEGRDERRGEALQEGGTGSAERAGAEAERNQAAPSSSSATGTHGEVLVREGEEGNALANNEERREGEAEEEDEDEDEEEEQSVVPVRLPYGAREHSWRRIAPTLANGLPGEATLTFSKNFNSQLESILSTFTVTARSRIVH